MDYIFYQVAAINGFDSFGHYLRAGLIVNPCSTLRDRRRSPGCSANFALGASAPRDAAAAAGATRCCAHRRGAAAQGARRPRSRRRRRRRSRASTTRRRRPRARRRRRRRRTPTPAAAPTPAADRREPGPSALLDYLFGRTTDERPRRRHRRQPGPDRRRDGARGARRRVPVLQRQPGPAVRARPTSSRPRCRAPPTWSVGNDVRIGGARVGAVDAITPKRARRRHERRGARRSSSSKRRRAAAEGLDADHPPALGARPQVRRDHARHARREGFEDGDTIPLAAAHADAGRVRRVPEHVRRARRATAIAGEPRAASATRSPAAASRINTAIGALRAAAARHHAGGAEPVRRPRRDLRALLRRARRHGARSSRPPPRRRPSCSSTSTPRSRALREVARPFIQDSITEGVAGARRRHPRASRTSARSCATPSGLFRELRPGAARAARRRRPTSPTRSRPARARCPSTPPFNRRLAVAAAGAAALRRGPAGAARHQAD